MDALHSLQRQVVSTPLLLRKPNAVTILLRAQRGGLYMLKETKCNTDLQNPKIARGVFLGPFAFIYKYPDLDETLFFLYHSQSTDLNPGKCRPRCTVVQSQRAPAWAN